MNHHLDGCRLPPRRYYQILLRKIRAASVDDIAEVPGIGRRTAEAIVGALAEQTRPVTVNTSTGEIEEG